MPFFIWLLQTHVNAGESVRLIGRMAGATPQSSTLNGRQLAGYVSLCLIWGTTWLGIRLVVRDVPPFEALAFRLFAAGVLLLVMALAQKRRWPTDSGEWNAILILTLTIMAVPYALAVLGGAICHFFNERGFVFRVPSGGLAHHAGHDAPQGATPGCLCHGDGLRRNPCPLL